MSALLYHVLFLLEADTDLLFEIKRLDVQSQHPADVFFWFRFGKASGALQPLMFVAMSQTDGEQQREFAEGRLAFGPSYGSYQPLSNSSPLILQTVSSDILPPVADAAVQAFLTAR